MTFTPLDPQTSSNEILFYLSQLYTELFGPEAALSEDVARKVFTEWQQRSINHRAFKVVDSENVVAFFTLSESFAFFAHGSYGVINELWVAPGHRGRGVGGKVLHRIQELARESGWTRVDVSAPEEDRWIRSFEFYKKNGFKFTGKKLKYWIDNKGNE